MNTQEKRRLNLINLIAEFSTIEAFAEETGLDKNYVSQIKNGHRNMGNSFARRVEIASKKPEGWMDEQHNDLSMYQNTELTQIASQMTKAELSLWLHYGEYILDKKLIDTSQSLTHSNRNTKKST